MRADVRICPHYCIMIPLMMLYLNGGSIYWFMLFFFYTSELVGKG